MTYSGVQQINGIRCAPKINIHNKIYISNNCTLIIIFNVIMLLNLDFVTKIIPITQFSRKIIKMTVIYFGGRRGVGSIIYIYTVRRSHHLIGELLSFMLRKLDMFSIVSCFSLLWISTIVMLSFRHVSRALYHVVWEISISIFVSSEHVCGSAYHIVAQ